MATFGSKEESRFSGVNLICSLLYEPSEANTAFRACGGSRGGSGGSVEPPKLNVM